MQVFVVLYYMLWVLLVKSAFCFSLASQSHFYVSNRLVIKCQSIYTCKKYLGSVIYSTSLGSLIK